MAVRTEIRSGSTYGMGWSVSVAHSPSESLIGRTYRLQEQVIHLQRAPDQRLTSIQLSDPAVSQDAVRLQRRDDHTYELLDRGATNPVRVNGASHKRVALAPNDIVRIGDTLLIVDRDMPTRNFSMDPLQAERMVDLRKSLGLHGSAASALFEVEASLVGLEHHSILLWAPNAHEAQCCAQWLAEGWDQQLETVNSADPNASARIKALPANRALLVDRLDFCPGEGLADVERELLRRLNGLTPSLTIVSLPFRFSLDEHPLLAQILSKLGHVELHIPALSSRKRDVLVALEREAGETVTLPQVPPDVAEHCLVHQWPGELNELRRVARRIASLHRQGQRLVPSLLPGGLAEQVRIEPSRRAPELTEESLREAFEEFDGNMTAIADSYGYSRTYFYRLLRQLEVDVQKIREEYRHSEGD